MEKTDVTSNGEPKSINTNEVLEIYSFDELKFQACESRLIGNFDKDKNYKILDIIYPELIKINKVITEKNTDYYTAVAFVHQLKLKFFISIKRLPKSQISATLYLKEKLCFGKIYEHTISTPIKTIIDDETPNFMARVREEFHLKSKDEQDQQELLEDYISPPIELVTELIKKEELLVAMVSARENCEAEYVTNLLKELKNTPSGQDIAKTFFTIIKDNNLHKLPENKMRVFKQVLDFLIDQAVEQGVIEPETIQSVGTLRKDFLVQTKQAVFESILPPSTPKTLQQEVKQKTQSSPPKQSPSSPPQEKPKEKPQEKQKEEKVKQTSLNRDVAPLSSKKQFKAPHQKPSQSKHFSPAVNPRPTTLHEQAPQPSINALKPAAISQAGFSSGIWQRAKDDTQPEPKPLIPKQADFIVYQQAIITATKTTYGLGSEVDITVTEIKETVKVEEYSL